MLSSDVVFLSSIVALTTKVSFTIILSTETNSFKYRVVVICYLKQDKGFVFFVMRKK